MQQTLTIQWNKIEPLAQDLPLDREEIEGVIEALVYSLSEIYKVVITNTDQLIDLVGRDMLREILMLLSTQRLAEVA